jgi:hypothetical protein
MTVLATPTAAWLSAGLHRRRGNHYSGQAPQKGSAMVRLVAARPSHIERNWWVPHLRPVRSKAEVAAILRISMNAVHTHESSALRKLRAAIAADRSQR